MKHLKRYDENKVSKSLDNLNAEDFYIAYTQNGKDGLSYWEKVSMMEDYAKYKCTGEIPEIVEDWFNK